MSVLVSSLSTHHAPFFSSNNPNRRINGNISTTKQTRLTTKTSENEMDSDHVPYGVVNSMKQRLLNKVNESYLLNNTSTSIRHSLLKSSSRISSNENLLQTKPSLSPLKRTARLSRSQDNLTNNNTINSITGQTVTAEQFTSYIQPKQDVIIVDTPTATIVTPTNNENNDEEGKLRAGQKTLTHRQSYTELHVDEAPKPGMLYFRKNELCQLRFDIDLDPSKTIEMTCLSFEYFSV
jgi:hypothetical protein